MKAVFVALGLALILVSCASTPTQSRGSLSDAMGKARDDSEDRSVPEKPKETRPPATNRPPVNNHPSSNNRPPANQNPPHNDDPSSVEDDASYEQEPIIDFDGFFGFRYGYSPLVSKDIAYIHDSKIVLGGTLSPHLDLVLDVGFVLLSPNSDSTLAESLSKDSFALTSLCAGFEFRYTIYPQLTLFSPWVGCGIDALIMTWHYRNALVAGSETISTDSLRGASLRPSLGFTIFESPSFAFLLYAQAEAYLFNEITQKGFDNDVFPEITNLQFGAEVHFK